MVSLFLCLSGCLLCGTNGVCTFGNIGRNRVGEGKKSEILGGPAKEGPMEEGGGGVKKRGREVPTNNS